MAILTLLLLLNVAVYQAQSGTSLNKVFREGTTAMLHCLTKSESKVVLTSWNKIDPTTSITAHEIFKFNEAKDAGQSRYSLAENRLVVSEIKISDEGCYRQQVFDSSRRQVEECNITVTVYVEPHVNFSMDLGPHGAGTPINMECQIDRIYPRIPRESFNITFARNNQTIFFSEFDTILAGAFQLKVSGTFNASIEYDEDVAICQLTTAVGHYLHNKIRISVYKSLREKIDVFENQTVVMKCPREKSLMQYWKRKGFGQMSEVENEPTGSIGVGPSYIINVTRLTDEGIYECHAGRKIISTVHLEVNVNEALRFETTMGPYDPGQNISIKCEVPRVQGNLPTTRLQVYIGDSPIGKAKRHANGDNTKRISLRTFLSLDLSYDGMSLSCHYISSNGTFQQRNLTIHVLSGALHRIKTISGASVGVFLGSAILIGLAVYCFIKRKTLKRTSLPDQRNISTFRLSQYDQIDESEIQHPEGTGHAILVEGEKEGGKTQAKESKLRPPIERRVDGTQRETTGPSRSTGGQRAVVAVDTDSGYERPQCCKATSEVEVWLKSNQVSQETCHLLHKEMVRTISDFKAMTEQDILDLGLPLGERIRLRESGEKLRQEEKDSSQKGTLKRMLSSLKL